MIKHLYLTILLSCLCQFLKAQNGYGNEWIDYTQKYYKFPIPKTGLYRLDSATIANSGFPLSTVNPKNIQLFIKGREQYVYLKGEQDGVFNSNDYLEFYAEKNDCYFDSLAYTNINRIPNPYKPLFNDTNYAFITWNNLVTNNRVTVESDINFSGYTPADYIYSKKTYNVNNAYARGVDFVPGYGVFSPQYLRAEGFGQYLDNQNEITLNGLSATVYQNSSLPITVKASVSGYSEGATSIGYDHHFSMSYLNGASSFQAFADTTFYGVQQIYLEKQISSTLVLPQTDVKFSLITDVGFGVNANRTVLHYIDVMFPQTLDMYNKSEFISYIDDDINSVKKFINFQNVANGSNAPIIYDLTNHKYLSFQHTLNSISVLVPNSNTTKQCFVTNNSLINTVPKILPVNQNGYFVNYLSASNTDSAFLIVTHKSLASSANAYANYRQSILGGSHNVIVSFIDDLYDQFAYGNTKNPLAIKNYCNFLSNTIINAPKYLLLFGKSIKQTDLTNNASLANCLVPTIGTPPSDILLTSGIRGTGNTTPFIPTGRLSVVNDNQGFVILNKVKQHEHSLLVDDINNNWHKNVLHFAGGSNLFEQQSLSSYLSVDSSIIVQPNFGGKVFTFKKSSTDPIDYNISDSVIRLINYGAGIINLFGHGTTSGFDQAIDNVSVYSNVNKYPLFIANSCYSGDIHTSSTNSASENFTLAQDKGSIGFLASSSVGIASSLHDYSSEIYRGLTYANYGKPIGDIIKQTCNQVSGFSPLNALTSLDMTYEGDPSLVFILGQKPDYKITNASVFFDTKKYIDSIGVNIKVQNNGKALKDTFIVKVGHKFPNGDSIIYYKKMIAPLNADTLTFHFYKDPNKHIGINYFNVFIDYLNTTDEILENNNKTNGEVSLFIPGGDVVPVYPTKYAIVPKTNQITLKASTVDPFTTNSTYRIQLDTNDVFSAPISYTVINSVGGVIEWTVNLPFADSTVYFWRISKDSLTTSDKYNWRESSFQTIGLKAGWGQAHFHQFKNDFYQFVKYKKAQRKFDFVNDNVEIKCRTEYGYGFGYTGHNLLGQRYDINGNLRSNWRFAFNGWTIAVFDSISGEPWNDVVSTNNTFAPTYSNCLAFSNDVNYAFAFGEHSYCGNDALWQTKLLNLLNAVPPNNYILAYTQDYCKASTYSNALYNAFEQFGSANIRTHNDSLPMIIFGKKRSVTQIGTAQEVEGTSKLETLFLTDSIVTKWNKGYIVSEIIGPANNWNSLHWNYKSQNTGNNNEITLKVIGIKANGQRDTIPNITLTNSTFDLYNLNTLIDATVYPTIQLIALMEDNTAHLAPQLKKWQVIYDEVPECAINPKKGFTVTANIQDGSNLIVTLPIENIGTLPFNDSLVISYSMINSGNVLTQLPQKLKANPFNAGQLIIDTIKVNSAYTIGTNQLWVSVNTPGNAHYQNEQYYFNNVARINFNVESDKINPILDVTFDGSHILNNEIISSKPNILITLKDENKFFALNDTANFIVYLKYPNQQTEKRIYFANGLQFTPAQLPNNSCKINWRPEFAEDGKYKLRVQATDKSRNASGNNDYTIQFEIVTAQTITEVLNYPNPFSTSTRFVFTLTGSEVPDIFTIQIMTITGKVVREITKSEIGNIHIGRNITQYAWDGKDDFGDKLANGVYLYRVITRFNGQAIEKRTTDADSFFKKGIGKLVIIR